MADSSQTAVAVPDHALANRSRGSTSDDAWAPDQAPDTEALRSFQPKAAPKPKAEFQLGIPDGVATPKTAVAAKPSAKRTFRRLGRFDPYSHFTSRTRK